jgi:N-acylneuraminate cytidylyltransferase
VEVLALIPARSGSKGIPNKNIMELAGKPILAYSIEHAQQAKSVTRIVVSTDDPEIAQVAREYGAEVPFLRPCEIAQDKSRDIETFSHALRWLLAHEGYSPQLVVHLRPTMPLRKTGDIDRAVELLQAYPEADSIRSVSAAKQSIYKMWGMGVNGFMEPAYNDDFAHTVLMAKLGTTHGKPAYVRYHGEQHSVPRQQLRQFLHQNGYIDVMRSGTLRKGKRMAGDCVLPFLVHHRLYELDYMENIPIVEDALRRHQAGEDVFIDEAGRHAL